MKASLEELKCSELGSGEVANPTSPIAPALASGVILRNGTADNRTFGRQSPLASSKQP